LRVDFDTEKKSVPWWQFWRETGRFQFISDSEDRSVSSLVYQTLND